MLKRFLFLLFILPLFAHAQTIITGKVISLVNQKPVADASVFLSNASVGGKTASDGSFTLYNVKSGQYDLVVTCIGYESHHQIVLINNTATNLPAISLMPKVTELKEVRVKYDPNRKAHLALFERQFLGSTDNARQCTFLNSEIVDLNYDKKTDKLTASTDDFLIIENKALGYRIKYLLKAFLNDPGKKYISFSGSAIFEAMRGTPAQEKRWQKNRMDSYYGSNMHFLRSCITNQIQEEGFNVFRLSRIPNTERPPDSLINIKLKIFERLTNDQILSDSLKYWKEKSDLPARIEKIYQDTALKAEAYIRLTEKRGIFAISYPDCLYITYNKSVHQYSVVTFNKPYTFFDNNGVVLNPDSYTMEGHWSTQRVAGLLPVDYELPAGMK